MHYRLKSNQELKIIKSYVGKWDWSVNTDELHGRFYVKSIKRYTSVENFSKFKFYLEFVGTITIKRYSGSYKKTNIDYRYSTSHRKFIMNCRIYGEACNAVIEFFKMFSISAATDIISKWKMEKL